jgi:hypothetical protein
LKGEPTIFTRSTPISGDKLVYYNQKELYDLYIKEGRSHSEALALSQELAKGIQSLNKREQRMWNRALKERGIKDGQD